MSKGPKYDDRDHAWIITTDRWRDDGCYIALPINPETLELKHELRAEQGSNKRGKIIYISREHHDTVGSTKTSGWNSLFKPFDLQFSFNSGNIMPQFSDEYKHDCALAALQYSVAANNPYTPTENEKPETTAKRLQEDAQNLKNLRARIDKSYSVTQRFPSAYQTADYRDGMIHQSIQTTENKPNVPQLYASDVPVGIQNLYALIMLAEEPMFYKNKPNKVHVHINTLAFPSLMLSGTLTDSIHWSESAEEPASFNTNFTLHVVSSYPRFGYGKMSMFFENYQTWLSSTQTTLDMTKEFIENRYTGDTE